MTDSLKGHDIRYGLESPKGFKARPEQIEIEYQTPEHQAA